MTSDVPLYALTAFILLAAPARAGQPIVIGDGSVCMDDGERQFPGDATSRHERPFVLENVWVETSRQVKKCEPAAQCSGADCQAFGAGVKEVVVEYREANVVRPITVTFDGKNVRITLSGQSFDQWDPQKAAHRTKRRPNARIERIIVDGRPIDCGAPAHCRVTLRSK